MVGEKIFEGEEESGDEGGEFEGVDGGEVLGLRRGVPEEFRLCCQRNSLELTLWECLFYFPIFHYD
jgi:hypothetical protein